MRSLSLTYRDANPLLPIWVEMNCCNAFATVIFFLFISGLSAIRFLTTTGKLPSSVVTIRDIFWVHLEQRQTQQKISEKLEVKIHINLRLRHTGKDMTKTTDIRRADQRPHDNSDHLIRYIGKTDSHVKSWSRYTSDRQTDRQTDRQRITRQHEHKSPVQSNRQKIGRETCQTLDLQKTDR